MKDSRFDRVLRKLEIRAMRVSGKISGDLKGVKPFDKEPMSPEDELADYMVTDERVKEAMRQQFPEYTQYEQGLLKKMEGMKDA